MTGSLGTSIALILLSACLREVDCLAYQKRVQTKSVTGTYKHVLNSLEVLELPGHRVRISFAGYWPNDRKRRESRNVGSFDETVPLTGNTAIVKIQYGEDPCTVTLEFRSNRVIVAQGGSVLGCGFGFNVEADGTYVKLSSKPPRLQLKQQTSGTTAQLRGVSAVSSTVAWASGSNGTFLRTTDGGAKWTAATVPGAGSLDFRDVEAIDANTAHLLATAGKIYKTTDGGGHWALQYDNTAPGVFLDAFGFWDPRHGIAIGDPINGRFLILTTSDGGESWTQVPAQDIPPSIEGEAAFAASGTCIAVDGKQTAWFGTGGRAARVFRSTDRGRTWKVSTTPITSGADSTGIFSIAFRDAKHGVVVGGDYKKPDETNKNAARTTDGGATWNLIASRPDGFRSGVAFVPGTTKLVAVGQTRCDFSSDDGVSWNALSKEGYHSISFATSRVGWVVGADGRIGKIEDARLLDR